MYIDLPGAGRLNVASLSVARFRFCRDQAFATGGPYTICPRQCATGMKKHNNIRGLSIVNTLSSSLLALIVSLGVTVSPQVLAQNSSPVVDCDRACLFNMVDRYMQALEQHQPLSLPWADQVVFSENSVQLKVGDGLWNTYSGRRAYDLKMADAEQGQAGWFAVVEEHGVAAILAGRMKVVGGKITEVETVLSRRVDDSPFPVADNLVTPDPVYSETVPVEDRIPRARLISITNGYFDTLQLNNGTLFTEFHDDCDRIENGLRTTNTFVPNYPISAMGCADQFRMGQYIYDDRLRGRRYPLVDEERGLVLAAGFIDHTGTIVDVTWNDGVTKATSPFFYPHSFVYLELFKVDHGKIRRVESVFASVPYNMPSPWPEASQ